MYTVSAKESNNSDSVCLITLCYFRNTSPNSISNLVMYWAGNNILSGVDLIQPGINLQWIPIHNLSFYIYSKFIHCFIVKVVPFFFGHHRTGVAGVDT